MIAPEARSFLTAPIVTLVGGTLGGAAVIVVVSLLVSFEPFGSLVEDEAFGFALIVPDCECAVFTAMSIAALPPLASEPAAHLTVVPSLVQLKAEPSICAAPIKVVPDGIGTLSRGWDASEGPSFWTCMW